jgi:hypothetical protein
LFRVAKSKQILGKEYKSVSPSGQVYKLILRIKKTGEYGVFGGYQLGTQGSGIVVEVLKFSIQMICILLVELGWYHLGI